MVKNCSFLTKLSKILQCQITKNLPNGLGDDHKQDRHDIQKGIFFLYLVKKSLSISLLTPYVILFIRRCDTLQWNVGSRGVLQIIKTN
jgi:hypothetical protein